MALSTAPLCRKTPCRCRIVDHAIHPAVPDGSQPVSVRLRSPSEVHRHVTSSDRDCNQLGQSRFVFLRLYRRYSGTDAAPAQHHGLPPKPAEKAMFPRLLTAIYTMDTFALQVMVSRMSSATGSGRQSASTSIFHRTACSSRPKINGLMSEELGLKNLALRNQLPGHPGITGKPRSPGRILFPGNIMVPESPDLMTVPTPSAPARAGNAEDPRNEPSGARNSRRAVATGRECSRVTRSVAGASGTDRCTETVACSRTARSARRFRLAGPGPAGYPDCTDRVCAPCGFRFVGGCQTGRRPTFRRSRLHSFMLYYCPNGLYMK